MEKQEKEERLVIQRAKIVEEKMHPEKIYTWSTFCKLMGISIPQNSDRGYHQVYVNQRNGCVTLLNVLAKSRRLLWRLKVAPNIGVQKIENENIVPLILINALKRVVQSQVSGEDRLTCLAETMELPIEYRKKAEKAAVLLGAGIELLEHGLSKSKLLKQYKDNIIHVTSEHEDPSDELN